MELVTERMKIRAVSKITTASRLLFVGNVYGKH